MVTNVSMASRVVIGALVATVVGIVGIMALQGSSGRATVSDHGVQATIYKSPSCSCCEQYAAYLEREGYRVDVERTTDMSAVKERYSVPYELESCHTMEIGGYVVEGHVPEVAVQKLLAETPNIKGIGMAGMPSGSPGMPGPKTSDFVVYEITHDGTRGDVFMSI